MHKYSKDDQLDTIIKIPVTIKGNSNETTLESYEYWKDNIEIK